VTDVKEIVAYLYSAAFLKNNGDLYIAGTEAYHSNPYKLDSDVIDIRGGYYTLIYEKNTGTQCQMNYRYTTSSVIDNSYGKAQVNYSNYNTDDCVYFRDGKVYRGSTLVTGVENPVQLFYLDGSYYVLTEDGSLYGFGENDDYELADLTQVNRYDEAKKIFFGIGSDDEALTFDSSNIVDGILPEATLVIDFNRAIMISSGYPNIQLKDSTGMVVYIEKELRLDKFIVTPVDPLVNGETYTLTIPSSSFITAWGKTSVAQTLTFTYHNDTAIEFWETDIVDDAILTDGILDGYVEYTFAIAGDRFNEISLTLNGQDVAGFEFSLANDKLTLSAENLLPGEYTLSADADETMMIIMMLDAFGNFLGLILIGRERTSSCCGAEAAITSTDVAQDHKCCSTTTPTLRLIGTHTACANSMQAASLDDLLDLCTISRTP
jgi:hypothetical protein